MSTRTKTYLKQKFESGDKPTQEDFHDLIDSTAFELDELHDVLITNRKNEDVLMWSAASGVFINSDALSGKETYHGFVNRTSSIISFDDATMTFSISGDNYPVYFDGRPHYGTGIKSITLSASPEWGDGIGSPIGQWFIWMYSNGTLGCSKLAWDILSVNVTPVATVYIQPATTAPTPLRGILAEERHGYKRNLIWHNHAHYNYGTAYTSGFTTSPSISGNNTFSFAGGKISDEDIINDSSGTRTTCSVGYRRVTISVSGTSTNMQFDTESTAFAKVNINGCAVMDVNTVLTAMTAANQYGAYYIYATNKTANPITSIMGQGIYSSVVDVQAAPYPVLSPSLSVAEWKLLYRVIIKGSPNSFSVQQVDALFNVSTGPVLSTVPPTVTTASSVSVAPNGGISSTNVQNALLELDSEKVSTTFTINGQPLSGSSIKITETTYTDSMAVTAVEASGGYRKKTLIQNLGIKSAGTYTIDFNSGTFVTFTASGNSTINIPNFGTSTTSGVESVDAWLYITQGSAGGIITIGAVSGTNNNVVGSGAYAKALPNSGANLIDAYCFTWTGSKWMITNMLFDVKAIV